MGVRRVGWRQKHHWSPNASHGYLGYYLSHTKGKTPLPCQPCPAQTTSCFSLCAPLIPVCIMHVAGKEGRAKRKKRNCGRAYLSFGAFFFLVRDYGADGAVCAMRDELLHTRFFIFVKKK